MTDILERQLIELAQRLDVPDDDQLVRDVLGQLEPVPRKSMRRRSRRVLLAAAICFVAVLATVLLLPGPRHTIAHWLGIGSTRIDTSSTGVPGLGAPATFPASLDFGSAMNASDAAARTGLPVPLVREWGTPAGIFVVSPPSRGQVVVVYAPSASLPASPVAGVGALVSSMPGVINDGLFGKMRSPSTTIDTLTFTSAAGRVVQAIWLSGSPHDYVFQDVDGTPVFDTLRLATNTLLWQDGDVTYRLEASVPRAQAVHIAAMVGSP